MANPIDSKFALLDVEKGRSDLARRIAKGENRIPVTIRGFITGQWGNDDGISTEFEVECVSVVERAR